MVYIKRGGCCCACAFVLEAIALAAALIAITGTFWLDPVVTVAGSVLPGVENAGLWKVCYPEAPPVELATPDDIGTSDDGAVAATLFATDPGDPDADAVVSGFADDAPGAPRRAGPPAASAADTTDGSEESLLDRLTNASDVLTNIQRDLDENLPWTEGSPNSQCVTITGYREMTLYSDVWGHDFKSKVDATRALTILFVGLGFVRLLYSMIVSVCTGDYAAGATCTGGALTTTAVPPPAAPPPTTSALPAAMTPAPQVAPPQVQLAALVPVPGMLPTTSLEDEIRALGVQEYSRRLSDFHGSLIRLVYGEIRYPKRAVRRSLEGRLELDLTITASGEVVAIAIAQDSGHRLLDEAAVEAAQTAFRDGLPIAVDPVAIAEFGDFASGRFTIPLPVNFRLQ